MRLQAQIDYPTILVPRKSESYNPTEAPKGNDHTLGGELIKNPETVNLWIESKKT